MRASVLTTPAFGFDSETQKCYQLPSENRCLVRSPIAESSCAVIRKVGVVMMRPQLVRTKATTQLSHGSTRDVAGPSLHVKLFITSVIRRPRECT